MKKMQLIIGLLVCINSFTAYSLHPLYGCQSMVGTLKKVLVRRPDKHFGVEDYKKWHYSDQPNVEIAQKEHDDFVAILKQYDVQIVYHDQLMPEHADSIFVHDPVIITAQGAIILKMGKSLRNGEESAIEHVLNSHGVPTLYKLTGSARAEGGDIVWLNANTLAVGRGFRTNDEGIAQIKEAVNPLGVQVIVVDLPYDQGQEACLHLQSLISLVDHSCALVYKKLLPVFFVNYLQTLGFKLIDVPDNEYLTMGPNVLAIAPKLCLMIEGNPETKKRLEAYGCTVHTYKGDEISHKAEGGATCLTRPIIRE